MNKLTLVATRILPDWDNQLEAMAKETDTNKSELIRDAIACYLKTSKAPKVASRLSKIERQLAAIMGILKAQD